MYHRIPEYGGNAWQCSALLGGATEMVSALRHGASCPAAGARLDRLGIAQRERKELFAYMRETSSQIHELARSLGS
jgi:hypothetical protein